MKLIVWGGPPFSDDTTDTGREQKINCEAAYLTKHRRLAQSDGSLVFTKVY